MVSSLQYKFILFTCFGFVTRLFAVFHKPAHNVMADIEEPSTIDCETNITNVATFCLSVGWQLQEVGDFESLDLIRNIKFHLSTESLISCRCCYGLVLFCFLCV